MPPGKQLLRILQQFLTDTGRLAAARHEVLEGAPQMGPTNLAARHWQMSVGREAIGADDRGAVVAEQLIDDLPTAAPANGEYRDPSCDHHPQPSPETTHPPARALRSECSNAGSARYGTDTR